MMRPREVGGYEADPLTQHEVIDRLSFHDPSTGWCGFIGAGSSAFVAGNIPQAGLEEVQASLPPGKGWARIAGSPQPLGRAQPVDGGYRVSGRWAWASGVHHSDWVFAGASVLRDGEVAMTEHGIPEAFAFVLPKRDVVIEDTWQVAGLRGTGSAHFHTEDCFVPEGRAIPFPFAVAQRGGVLFRLPVLGFFGPAFSGFPQGVGRRALQEIAALAGSKTRAVVATPLSERGVFQRDLALAHDRLRAAGLLVRHELAALWQRLHDDLQSSELEGAHLLAAFSGNGDAALHAIEIAYRYAGGDAVYRTSPFQQLLRDMRVAAQHMLIGEQNYEALGKALLNAAPANPV
jgi:alkylation response protein AidB-like acyl-CoA dehydrogenase